MKKFKKVLVIDDDQINNIIFEKLASITTFADEVVSMMSAVDGLDYLQQLQTNQQAPPDIVFLDIRMPIVSGWEFLERFQLFKEPYFKDTMIIMLTSSSDQSDVNKAKNFAIVTDYIVKPLSVEALQNILENNPAIQMGNKMA